MEPEIYQLIFVILNAQSQMNVDDSTFIPYRVPGKELSPSACILPFLFVLGYVLKGQLLMNIVTSIYLIADVLMVVALRFVISNFTTYGYSLKYYHEFPSLYFDWSAQLNIKYYLTFFLIELPFLSFLFYASYDILFYLLIFSIYSDMIYVKVMRFSVNQSDVEYYDLKRMMANEKL